MFHLDFFEKLIGSSKDFSLDLCILFQARLHNFTILEYPAKFGKRLHGESKGSRALNGKLKLIRRILSYMLKLKYNLGR